MTISSAVWIQYTNVTDRWTNSKQQQQQQQRLHLLIVSHAKIAISYFNRGYMLKAGFFCCGVCSVLAQWTSVMVGFCHIEYVKSEACNSGVLSEYQQ